MSKTKLISEIETSLNLIDQCLNIYDQYISDLDFVGMKKSLEVADAHLQNMKIALDKLEKKTKEWADPSFFNKLKHVVDKKKTTEKLTNDRKIATEKYNALKVSYEKMKTKLHEIGEFIKEGEGVI